MSDEYAAQIASGGQPISDPTPGEGKATPAPSVEQVGEPAGQAPGESQQPPEGQAADPGEDMLLAEMDSLMGVTPEKTEEQLRRDYAASSKEARRLNDLYEQLSESLKAQGVEVSLVDGQFGGLKALGNAEKGKYPVPPAVDGDLKELLFNDEEAAVASIWSQAQKAAEAYYANPTPTIESVSRPPSRDQLQAAETAITEAVDAAGYPVFPNAEKLAPVVKATMSRLSPALQEAFNADPRGMLNLIYGSAEAARARLIESGRMAENGRARKSAEAQEMAGLTPDGRITTHVGGQAGVSQAAAARIAGAVS
jgi:hypothetical protein